jgi:electron transport complex protein RnfD
MMWAVFICLTPAAIFGVLLFGLSALAVLLTALAAALLTEVAVTSALGLHHTLGDGSAAVTGLLLGMSMPPGVALHVPVIASVFAIAVVKWTFGGLGKNWMNPALAGRVFVFFSFETEMTQWRLPSVLVQNSASGSADAVSGATILGLLHRGQESGSIGAPSAFLRSAEFPVSRFDERITAFLNEHLFEPVHVFLPAGYVDPFLGLIPGSIGEVSALLLLLGTVFLWSRRILRWEISFSYFLAFALCTWVFGGTVYGTGPFSGDVLLHLLSGGLVLTLFYMANDPATAPMSPTGMIIYGSIAGILTFLLRFYGSYPEGVALAVLLANVATPVIDRWTRPARFGAAREGRA